MRPDPEEQGMVMRQMGKKEVFNHDETRGGRPLAKATAEVRQAP